jgi:type I restriction enzyme M protein
MKTIKLGEVVELFNGSTPLKTNKKYWVDGDIPWFTVDDLRKQGKYISYTEKFITKLGLKESSISLIPENAVLLCCTASVGAIAINKIRLTTNQQFNALVVKDSEQLSVEYLYYWFLANMDTLKSLGRATTIDYVSMSKLRDMALQLPTLEKQLEIVDKLDTAFAEIALLEENLEMSERIAIELSSSILNESFKGFAIDPEPHSDSGNLEITANLAKLGNVTSIQTGKIDVNKAVAGGKYPFFTCSRLEYKIDDAPFEGKAVLVAGNGDLNVKYYEGKFNAYQRTYFLFVKNEKELIPRYLYWFLESYIGQLRSESMGSTIKYIKMGNLTNAKIPIPSLDAQAKVISKLDTSFKDIERLRNQFGIQKDLARILRISYLDEAFGSKGEKVTT